MSHETNYYRILELDPSVSDWSTIEKRINEKKRVWAKNSATGPPKLRRAAALYLSLIKQMTAALSNDEIRRKYADEARAIERKKKKDDEAALQNQIAVLRTTGKCSEKQLNRLVAAYKGVLSKSEIEKRLKSANIEILGESGTEREKAITREYLDDTVRKAIWHDKSMLGLQSLYDLLGLPRKTSCATLRKEASRLNTELVQKKKTDPKSVARTALTGHAMNIFSGNYSKERYDNTLAVSAMELMKVEIELAADGGIIEPGALKQLIKQAGELRVDKDRAREYLEDLSKKRNWRILDSKENSEQAIVQCGLCDRIAGETGQKFCGHCKVPLEIPCPSCNTLQPNVNNACAKCGFSLEDLYLVTNLLRIGEIFEKQRNLETALKNYDEALSLWPGWEPAVSAKKHASDKLKSDIAGLEAIARTYFPKKQYVAAKKALEKKNRLSDLDRYRDLETEISRHLSRAKAACETGSRMLREGIHVQALKYVHDSLETCADCDEAKRLWDNIPITSPENLEVSVQKDAVDITWKNPCPTIDADFVIVRNIGGFPKSILDGETIAEASSSSFTDKTAKNGLLYYYGAATRLLGRTSDLVYSGPHIIRKQVTNLRATPGNRKIFLTWNPPANCKGVLVRRGDESARPTTSRGKKVPVSGRSAHDMGLENGKTYTYGVYTVYDSPNPNVTDVYSPAALITATPEKPPEMVKTFNLEKKKGDWVLLTWKKPAGAHVQIRMKSGKPPHAPGMVIQLANANELGQPVPGISGTEGKVDLAMAGEIFFTPLSIAAGTATVGVPKSVDHLPPVTDVISTSEEGSVDLRWTWPDGAKEAVVAVSKESFPQKPDGSGSECEVVRRTGSQSEGTFTRYTDDKESYYFSIFTRVGEKTGLTPAKIKAETGKPLRVEYWVELITSGIFKKQVEGADLVLECDECGILKNLVLRGMPEKLPARPDDGQLIIRIDEVEFDYNGRCYLEIPDRFTGTNLFVKLFFNSPKDAAQIKLIHSQQHEMKLG